MFSALRRQLTGVNKLNTSIHRGSRIQIGALLFVHRLYPTGRLVLLRFTLSEVAEFVGRVALPSLLARYVTTRLFLLVVNDMRDSRI